jgi:uncharacterized protein (TIGR02266 family)
LSLRGAASYGSIDHEEKQPVSDFATLARTARESLARGLNALQADPNVPPHIVALATPIAQAMGALHQIERSGGAPLLASAQAALTSVQTALAQLQLQPTEQPAVKTAIEAVAGALGGVHALVRAAQGHVAPTAPVEPAPPKAQAAPAQPPAATPAQSSARQQPPVAPTVPQQPRPQAATPQAATPQAAARANAAPAGDAPVMAAELGAHSPSNFFKGLAGNDIVDHGGLFVATYKLPKLGTRVHLRVSLPGGYEFEANAIVRWRREASDTGSDSPPGFGAQFTNITPEARQLVYRYVRNREPMFHDDL